MHRQEESFRPGLPPPNTHPHVQHQHDLGQNNNDQQKHKMIENTISLWAGLPPADDKAKKIENTVAMWAGESVDKHSNKRKITKKDKDKDREKKPNIFDFGLKLKLDKKEKVKPKPPKTNVPKMHSTPEIFQAEGPELPPADPIPLRFDALKCVLDHLESLKATESVGLFRVNGHCTSIEEIVRRLAEIPPPSFSEELPGEGINEFAGALKKYLREAPEPVIPFQDLRKFIDILEIRDPLLRQFALSSTVGELPEENQQMLRELCFFVRRVVDNADHNCMDMKNIAITFGPCVIRSKEFEFKTTSRCCEIFTLLVTCCLEIFHEPDFFDDQLQICSLGRRKGLPRKYILHIPQSQPDYEPQIGEETRRLLEN